MIYIVKQGDTVDTIAQENNVPVESVIYDNQIPVPYRLAIGQALFIQEPEEEQGMEKRTIAVSGYAYPFIREEVLTETLPYLTDMNVFSYGFSMEGNLIPPAVSDLRMIEAAENAGVNPILTLTPIDETGNFNNYLISALLGSEDAIRNLITQLLELMEQKNFAGLNLDFEYILADDRDAYTEFVRRVTQTLNEEGYPVSVALAPKTSDTQQGVLYEGQDYRGLGEVANHVLLMTYEWGYTYGPPMAVAPIDQVRRVVDYAVSVITPDKVGLGIPNYGYDWMLPYVRGTTRAQAIGNRQAVQIAISQGVEIQFDEVAQSPFYTYTEGGIDHEVWFEDVRSLNAKFDLVEEYGLRGVGYWQIMRFFRANWLQLESRFEKA